MTSTSEKWRPRLTVPSGVRTGGPSGPFRGASWYRCRTGRRRCASARRACGRILTGICWSRSGRARLSVPQRARTSATSTGYVAVVREVRGCGVGNRLRRGLRAAFVRDARRIHARPLEALIGEVHLDNPWLPHLVREHRALALDFPYFQPSLHVAADPVGLILYFQPLGERGRHFRPRRSANSCTRCGGASIASTGRAPRPEFRRMLRALKRESRIGSRSLEALRRSGPEACEPDMCRLRHLGIQLLMGVFERDALEHWPKKADVYITQKGLANGMNVSLHPGGYRVALAQYHVRRERRLGRWSGTDRVLDEWKPVELAPGTSVVFRMMIPESEVTPASASWSTRKPVSWLPIPPEGHGLEIGFFIVRVERRCLPSCKRVRSMASDCGRENLQPVLRSMCSRRLNQSAGHYGSRSRQ